MKLKNFLIVVKDIGRAKQFYHDLFGLEMITDNDGNMILTEGLVLQEERYWKEFLGKEIIPESNSCELYFEESDIDGFIEKLERYYQAGINRLSVGLQTSNNKILKLIGRIHTYEQYVKTIQLAKDVGFTNINSDIIIGLPEQTIYDVEDTINKLLELDLTHISIYSLIIEENTKIEKMINDGMVKLPDEEIERYMYWFAKRKLEKNGYIHYEISNFSKPGYMSKHNMDCWKQKEYLGFGVSASSYENKKRYSNTNSIKKYIKNINMNKLENNINVEEKQTISDQRNEYMILGLRKLSGINIDEFVKKFSRSPLVIYRKQIEDLLAKDLITIDINSIKLSKKGLDFANIVWEEFI